MSMNARDMIALMREHGSSEVLRREVLRRLACNIIAPGCSNQLGGL